MPKNDLAHLIPKPPATRKCMDCHKEYALSCFPDDEWGAWEKGDVCYYCIGNDSKKIEEPKPVKPKSVQPVKTKDGIKIRYKKGCRNRCKECGELSDSVGKFSPYCDECFIKNEKREMVKEGFEIMGIIYDASHMKIAEPKK